MTTPHARTNSKTDTPSAVQAGGPSTFNGVLYQMLWSLLRTTRLYVQCQKDADTGTITDAILRLEPIGGGGDLQEIRSSGTIVEQIKARSTGALWPLRDIIDTVLPDFYRADPIANEYRFITESGRGDWEHVYDFFKSLRSIEIPASNILESIDATEVLQFDHRISKDEAKQYWCHTTYTRRTLFEHIVERLRTKSPAKDEPFEITCRNLWLILSRFEMSLPQPMHRIRSEVDKLLIAMGCPNNDVENLHNSMLADLMVRSTSGNADIDVRDFLRHHNLSVPLTHWWFLKNDSKRVLHKYLQIKQFDINEDVRADLGNTIANSWSHEVQIVVLAGESGSGKSWAAWSSLLRLSDRYLVLATESKCDADADKKEAAESFCAKIWDLDKPLSLARIPFRMPKDEEGIRKTWLTLYIDDIQNADEARKLAETDWRELGINLLVSCSPTIAQKFSQYGSSSSRRIDIPDFTLAQLHSYLRNILGSTWASIPFDIKDTLRRPILAKTYREVTSAGNWEPTKDSEIEYQLYAKYWKNITDLNADEHSLDNVHLANLAIQVLAGFLPPWHLRVLLKVNIGNNERIRLVKSGWLRKATNDCYEIPHTRLLNWAVAQGLVQQYQAKEISDEELCLTLTNLFRRRLPPSSTQPLAYVPMDVLYVLTRLSNRPEELIDDLIRSFEQIDWRHGRDLYKRLLPSLGTGIIPALVRRLASLTAETDSIASYICEGLSRFSGDVVAPEALRLLEHQSPLVRRYGCLVFAKCPSAQALDRLWHIRCEIYRNEAVYRKGNEERSFASHADSEASAALRACIRLDPEWLTRAARAFQPTTMPLIDLLYMSARLEGHCDIWHQCQEILSEHFRDEHNLQIIRNIRIHRDKDSMSWLLERTRSTNRDIAASAVRAITYIDPDRILSEMSDLVICSLAITDPWVVGRLLQLRNEQIRSFLIVKAGSADGVQDLAVALYKNEYAIDIPLLEILLNGLEMLLTSQDYEVAHDLFQVLKVLCNIRNGDMIDHFTTRRDTPLETMLTDWLIFRTQANHFDLRFENKQALSLLERIGGSGYTRVVNAMMMSPSEIARTCGFGLAHRNPDAETLRLSEEASMQSDNILDEELDLPSWQRKTENSSIRDERRAAILALARLELWQQCIKAVVHAGFSSPAAIGMAPLVLTPLNDYEMSDAFNSLNSPDPTVGAILSIGLGQRKDMLGKLCDLLAHTPPDSKIAQACLQTCTYLENSGDQLVPLLEQQLAVQSNYQLAWIALLRNGSDKAIEILLNRISRSYDQDIAIYLLHNTRTKQNVIRLIEGHFDGGNIEDILLRREFEELIVSTDDLTMISNLLNRDAIQEYIRELASAGKQRLISFHDAQVAGIRALAVSDRQEAYDVALAALMDENTPNRIIYPELLMDLDPHRAEQDLVTQMTTERYAAQRWAMGQTLAHADLTTLLKDRMKSENVNERIAACQIAGYQRGNALVAQLEHCLNDPYQDVSTEAKLALDKLQQYHDLNLLIDRYLKEVISSKRWVLLDVILDCGDPGYGDRNAPDWLKRLSNGMSYLTWLYVKERLKERREEQSREADRHDSNKRLNATLSY